MAGSCRATEIAALFGITFAIDRTACSEALQNRAGAPRCGGLRNDAAGRIERDGFR
jgi:hypothetical protein